MEISDSENESDAIEQCEQETRVSSVEALSAINKTIEWATAEKVSPQKVCILQSLREKAVFDIIAYKKRQTKITTYFECNKT